MSGQDAFSGAASAFAEAAAIMARLRGPDGCPWDREQTLDTIKPHTLEEVYEVFDAIDRRSYPELRDELGDLLLQVLFYAQIAADEQQFTVEDVIRGLSAKLIRRHPHIFGDAVAHTADAVIRTWESVKQQEKAGKPPTHEGLLSDIPRTMPALMEATRIGSRAAKIGFDWTELDGLFAKIHEELAEVQAELTEAPKQELIEEELGDLLFVVTNLARHLKVDPEQALRKANAKFRRRFRAMEVVAGSTEELQTMSLYEKEALWLHAKQKEKQS